MYNIEEEEKEGREVMDMRLLSLSAYQYLAKPFRRSLIIYHPVVFLFKALS